MEAENWDIRVDVDVAVRSWNPGPAQPETQTVPFNAKALHDAIDKEIRRIAKSHHWRVNHTIRKKGGAFRPTGWFKKPTYTTEIEIPTRNLTNGKRA